MAYASTNVEAFIAKMETQTGVLDDHLRPAYDRIIRSVRDVGAAQGTMQLALDISAAKGIAVEDVAKALGRAYDGNTGALGRLGLGLDKATLKSGDMHKITGDLTRLYAGQADSAANTYQGRINAISVAAENAKEAIGYSLIGAISKVSVAFGGKNGATDVVTGFGKGVSDLVAGVGDIAAKLATLAQKMGLVSSQTDASTKSNLSWMNSAVQMIPVVGSWLNALMQHGADVTAEDAALQTGPTLDQINARRGLGVNGIDPALANLLPKITTDHKGAATAAGSHASAVDYTAEAYKKLKTAYDDWYKNGLDTLKGKLDDATKAFDDFKTSVRDSIAGALNFGDAAQEFDKDGAKVGKSFIEKLQEQATLAVGFAEKVKTLIAMNLSHDALAQVLSAGAAAGSSIADEIISGGAEAITTTNSLVSAAQSAGDEVGTLAATNFYGAGVKSAQSLVDAFAAEYGPKGKSRAAIMAHMDALAESMSRTATVTVTTINRVVSQAVPAVKGGGVDGNVATPFANGGLVTSPMIGLVGEAGPELIVPLDRVPQMQGGGGGLTVLVNVQGSVTSERDLAVALTDHIAQNIRRRGGDTSVLGV